MPGTSTHNSHVSSASVTEGLGFKGGRSHRRHRKSHKKSHRKHHKKSYRKTRRHHRRH
jgi:hypothetical protein